MCVCVCVCVHMIACVHASVCHASMPVYVMTAEIPKTATLNENVGTLVLYFSHNKDFSKHIFEAKSVFTWEFKI